MSAPSNRPPRQFVKDIIEVEAWRHGVDVASVYASRAAASKLARRRSWTRILDETGCSINGLATVWGIDRQAIWRVHRAKVS